VVIRVLSAFLSGIGSVNIPGGDNMRKSSIGVLLLALVAGNAAGETLNGQFLFHSKDGKVVGIKSPAGLVALDDGQQMQVNGVSSIDSFKSCDEVEIDFTRTGKQRVINSIALKKGAGSASCDTPSKPLPLSRLNKALADKSATILDIRAADEYAKAHLDGAINIPLGEIEAKIPELPKDKPIIIYCHTGRRAAFAAGLLQEKGVGSGYVKGKFTVKDGKAQIIE
jgi:rhodanese-related sulfurtransferase